MGKNKKQKRKTKVKTKQTKQNRFQVMTNSIRVDENKINSVFQDINDRKKYLTKLIEEMG